MHNTIMILLQPSNTFCGIARLAQGHELVQFHTGTIDKSINYSDEWTLSDAENLTCLLAIIARQPQICTLRQTPCEFTD